ncbi:hypothetical protein NRIC_17010 [Enterococcus florum]|uniref:OmpR/PhoB-type domain-containing protein n=1 Tax=Enterococcus florum TaxID=2480627 RepID=A0A4P5P7L5_9ENTE|nr:hypothetical protein NRIC_17010 [Enterococcus florum]
MIDFLHFFNIVIFSETLSNREVENVLEFLEKPEFQFVRRAETTSEKQSYSKEVHYLPVELSLSELREQMLKFAGENQEEESFGLKEYEFSETNRHNLLTFYNSLNKLELRILKVLLEHIDGIVSREELCTILWEEGMSNSRLVQISSAIGSIRKKMEQANVNDFNIITYWRNGYRLSELIQGSMTGYFSTLME